MVGVGNVDVEEREALSRLMRVYGITVRDAYKFCRHGQAIGKFRLGNLRQTGRMRRDLVALVREDIEALARLRGWDGDYESVMCGRSEHGGDETPDSHAPATSKGSGKLSAARDRN